MPRRPVYLHSGFRSGSTWFWSRFRACADAYAYCEPFNVQLATLTEDSIAVNRPDAWRSGHPTLQQPYYAEYKPLLKPDGGVAHFQSRFAIESYYQTDADSEAERYIAALNALAQLQGRTPVLGFCCSLGRVAWFRHFLDGINIVTWRNPRDQWCSSHRQWTEEGNFHFEVHYLLVAYIGGLDPAIAPFLQGLPLIPPPDEIAPEMPLFGPAGVADRFRVFLRIFLLDMLFAIESADTVIDLDIMSLASAYRKDVTDRLRLETGLVSLSFEDCNLPPHRFPGDADYIDILLEESAWLDALQRSPQGASFPTALAFIRPRLLRLIALENSQVAPVNPA